VRLWNPARLDPAFPPGPSSGGTATLAAGRDVPFQSLPRALPIQVYRDAFTHPVSAVAVDDDSTILLAASDKTLVVVSIATLL